MIPVGERLADPESYPVAFARDGRVFWRGRDNYFRYWPTDFAERMADNFASANRGWNDLAEPLRAAIAEALSYHETEEVA